MLGSTLRAFYRVSPAWAIFTELDDQWYFNQKGVGEAWFTDGTYANFGRASAGISLETLRISGGLKSNF